MDRDWKFAFKLAVAGMVILALAWLLVMILPVITYFIMAFIIFYSIVPLTKILVDKKIPPALAALASFAIVLLFLGLLFYLIIPGMIGELKALTDYLTREFIPDFMVLMEELEEMDRRLNLQLAEPVTDFFTQFVQELPSTVQIVLQRLTGITLDVLSQLWAVVVIVFIVFYLLIVQEKIRRDLPRLFPQVYRNEVSYVIGIVDKKVGAYIRGTILRCIIVGLLTGTALYIAGMPFAFVLGVLAGVLDVIVYIGPFMAAIPAVLFSLVPGTPHILVIIVIYVAIQLVESMVLTPLLMGKAVDLNPLTVIAAILIGGRLGGLLGIIISIPLAAVLKVLLHHYYINPMEENDKGGGP